MVSRNEDSDESQDSLSLPTYIAEVWLDRSAQPVGHCFRVAENLYITAANVIGREVRVKIGSLGSIDSANRRAGLVVSRRTEAHAAIAVLHCGDPLGGDISRVQAFSKMRSSRAVSVLGRTSARDWAIHQGEWIGPADTVGTVGIAVPGLSAFAGAPGCPVWTDRDGVVGMITRIADDPDDGAGRANVTAVPGSALAEVLEKLPRGLKGLGSGEWIISTRGYSDRPANKSFLNREVVAETISELLAPIPCTIDPDETDADLMSGPTVIALDGQWGSGKTSMAGFIEHRLKRSALDAEPGVKTDPSGRGDAVRPLSIRDAVRSLAGNELAWTEDMVRRPFGSDPASAVIHVNFQPWSHQTDEQVWAGMTKAMLDEVRKKVLPDADSNSRSHFVTQRYWFHRNLGRVDVQAMRRALLKSTISPALGYGVLALVAPLIAQMARSVDIYRLLGLRIAGSNIALLVTFTTLAIGAVHSMCRYVRKPAAEVLPNEVFVGPLGSGRFAANSTSGDGLRDPYFQARSGYLYLVQHDVLNVTKDLREAGYNFVVFIDDLDRCSPKTVTDVFEAINIFVVETFPAVRFILAIDSTAVASHIDLRYKELRRDRVAISGEDLSIGWGLLRKLVQLSVPLPQVRWSEVDQLLVGLLGSPESHGISPGDSGRSGPGPDHVASPGADIPSMPASSEVEGEARRLERNVKVRNCIARTLREVPNLSTREAKRTLTLWQYCVRVASRLEPVAEKSAIERACHLYLLADFVARWPASQRQVHRRVDDVHGMVLLHGSAADDWNWIMKLRLLELDGDPHQACAAELRKLLAGESGGSIAKLADLIF